MEGWTVWWRECPLRDYAKVRDALREEGHRVREEQQTVEASIQYTRQVSICVYIHKKKLTHLLFKSFSISSPPLFVRVGTHITHHTISPIGL